MSPGEPFDRHDLARTAFDLSPSGMLAVDESGLIVVANREAGRLFGCSHLELAGLPVETLIPARYQAGHPGHREAFARDPRSRPMGAGRDLFALRRDGSEFPVEIGLNPVATPRGRFVLVSVVDITARLKMEEERRRSHRLETIGVLAGGIAHDFNNILLGIVGHAELALRAPDTAPQARHDLDGVLKAAERGRLLVERILAFSRDAEIARVPLHLERPIGEAVALLRASLPSTVEIRTELDPETPIVLADETQVHQIVLNLATNSSQAMPSGGVIDVRLQPVTVGPGPASDGAPLAPGRYARLTVRDQGTGMTPEVLARAREPFFTTKSPGQGTGLGLSMVHGIVASHGGVMEIASRPGHGTAVDIHLPAAEQSAATPAAGPARMEPRMRVRILFVEDEPFLATMQRRQLEYLGFDVTAHTSSLDALEELRTRPEAFDLLITDDMMPGMTGTRLAQEALVIRQDLPVLMVSGGDRADPSRPRPLGVRKILRKPHTAVELERAIGEVLRPPS